MSITEDTMYKMYYTIQKIPGGSAFMERLIKCGTDYILEAVEHEDDTFDALNLQERYEDFILYETITNSMDGRNRDNIPKLLLDSQKKKD